ncbi:cysteine hydrolase family protein [Leadbettera azotonutricia]|uniref:Isochorismatase hydrolase n=1 Tax=Leadbettera azotonutricia (strain ATCC BAA-888 / DSM 13862 / ZAS-9) TaxID=545695 RepID=F5YFM6_LEAAZ|nr:isochorismatase family cysteine hydrolase [Leadbettera azotonutricia]AEF80437.1 isochorismatase hydrolase [Leadbettera azotonutricia ZAS-9]
MKPALLVIDMQKASYFGPSSASMDKAAEVINKAAALFRKKGLAVVWIQQDNGTDAIQGTEKFKLLDSLIPLDSEKKIVKHYENSFIKTDLAEFLKLEKVDTPIISGYCAEYCVLSTYRGAKEQDLDPLLLKNGIAGGTPEYLCMVEQICESLSPLALEKLLH